MLISGTGSNLRALLESLRAAEAAGRPIPAEIVAIGADRDSANLALAEEFGLPSFVVRLRDFPDRAAWGARLLARIQEHRPDLTVFSGFMKLVPPQVVAALAPQLLNTHPAYLPEFPGAHGVRDALAAGVTRTGASLIVVDDGVDAGPVLSRERVPVLPDDTESSLHERIKTVERRLLFEAVRDIATGDLDLAAFAAGANPAAPAEAPPAPDAEPVPTRPSTPKEQPFA